MEFHRKNRSRVLVALAVVALVLGAVFTLISAHLRLLHSSRHVHLAETPAPNSAQPFPTSYFLNSATYSHDGKTIIMNCYGPVIWDVKTGGLLHILGDGAFPTLSQDGKMIATTDDNQAEIWDTSTGQQIQTVPEGPYSVSSASFSPDGRTVVSACESDPPKIWDQKTGKVLISLAGETGLTISSASFSPNGRLILATTNQHTAEIWYARTGALLHTLAGI